MLSLSIPNQTNIHSSKLSEQLESLMKVRQTEPEGLLAERIAQYEATTRGMPTISRVDFVCLTLNSTGIAYS